MTVIEILRKEMPDVHEQRLSSIILEFAISHPVAWLQCSQRAIANYILGVEK